MADAAWLEELVGPSLLSAAGDVATASLAGKTIALYYSAHWCGPCRRFTPKLMQFYADHQTAKNFEVIFVSCDRSDAEFQSYFGDMPWLAVKFSDTARVGFEGSLGKKYKVKGIPNLVLLEADGRKITSNAVQGISEDPTGDAFPYRPPAMRDVLPTRLVRNDGTPASVDAGKYTLYYFSAHWCPPCKRFTPKLIEWYNKRMASGTNDVEVVFVSSDRDAEGFNTYFGGMPWLAVPFADRTSVGGPLSSLLGVEGIPSLALFSPEGELLNKDCVMAVSGNKAFPFLPPNVVDLTDGISVWGFDVNTVPALVAFLANADDDDQGAVEERMETMAAEVKEAYTSTGDDDETPELIFITAKQDDEMTGQIQGICRLDLGDKVGFAILDIGDKGAFYTRIIDDSEDPADAVVEFATAFRTNRASLERQQMRK